MSLGEIDTFPKDSQGKRAPGGESLDVPGVTEALVHFFHSTFRPYGSHAFQGWLFCLEIKANALKFLSLGNSVMAVPQTLLGL